MGESSLAHKVADAKAPTMHMTSRSPWCKGKEKKKRNWYEKKNEYPFTSRLKKFHVTTQVFFCKSFGRSSTPILPNWCEIAAFPNCVPSQWQEG
jgi:hypothetical protein